MALLHVLSWWVFEKRSLRVNILSLLTIVLVIGFVLILILIVWGALARRRAAASVDKRRTVDAVKDARIEEGERLAAPISEQIEEMVRRILAAQGDELADDIDFGTGEDGSLEIWVEERCYSSPDEITDSKVRLAVQQAVEEFNRVTGDR